MPPSDLILVDTNVLVYAYDETSPHHHAAYRLIEQGRQGKIALCLTPQIMSEFFAVITDPKRVFRPFTQAEAVVEIRKLYYSRRSSFIYITRHAVGHYLSLLQQHEVTKQGIYDLQIAAAMIANQVYRICTYNQQDFEPFSEITVLSPDTVLQ